MCCYFDLFHYVYLTFKCASKIAKQFVNFKNIEQVDSCYYLLFFLEMIHSNTHIHNFYNVLLNYLYLYTFCVTRVQNYNEIKT